MTEASSSSEIFAERFELPNSRSEIERAQQTLLNAVERANYDKTSCFAIRLALEEALSNAFKHGNKSDPDKTVTLTCEIASHTIEIGVEDQGSGFDPDSIPDPTAEENIEIPAGRGIVLMKSFMTTVSYHPPGNRVQMRFDRPKSDG